MNAFNAIVGYLVPVGDEMREIKVGELDKYQGRGYQVFPIEDRNTVEAKSFDEAEELLSHVVNVRHFEVAMSTGVYH